MGAHKHRHKYEHTHKEMITHEGHSLPQVRLQNQSPSWSMKLEFRPSFLILLSLTQKVQQQSQKCTILVNNNLLYFNHLKKLNTKECSLKVKKVDHLCTNLINRLKQTKSVQDLPKNNYKNQGFALFQLLLDHVITLKQGQTLSTKQLIELAIMDSILSLLFPLFWFHACSIFASDNQAVYF